MIDLSTVPYHPNSEQLVQILCKKTQNDNPMFFRISVAYYFAKVASSMHTNIKTHDRGIIPVNVYAINLATSGFGKGHSTNIMEEQVINQFRERFIEETFPEISAANLAKLAVKRAAKKQTDDAEELAKVEREFASAGNLLFSFDSGTTPAIKQMRQKLLMADIGSMNLEIDEIGSNLMGNSDVLTTYLELYDVGKVKPKLIKNTAESIRNEDIDGRTPANMLLYGTPAKLLDGGKVEDELLSFLDTGYARRCLFGYSRVSTKQINLTPDQIYDMATDPSTDQFVTDLSDHFGNLADPTQYNKVLNVSKAVTLLLIEYKLDCERRASDLKEHEEIRKAELSHRYFKTLKLAGTYAFVDGDDEIYEHHALAAMRLVEDSGEAFNKLLTRDRNYVKLAKFFADVNTTVTHADLTEELPFYRGTASQKAELVTLATAWGYKNNIIIKKSFESGIEFLKGESLKETSLDQMIFSYSKDLATGYVNKTAGFYGMKKLLQQQTYHWINHHVAGGVRREDSVQQGFNLVVLDVDKGTSLATAQMLLQEYAYIMYTTKSHTPQHNRFRILLPLSHHLKMDGPEFKEFMNNIYEWLPFTLDTQTDQRSRKWRTWDGDYFENEGKMLDVLPFIPKTTKNEERKKAITDTQSLTNLERWFVANTGNGNRNSQMIKYALLLVDTGADYNSVLAQVLNFNDKLPDKMDQTEILSTIMISVAKKIHSRDDAA